MFDNNMTKSYNATTAEQRMGFVKRDELVTMRQQTPRIMNRLGADLGRFMAMNTLESTVSPFDTAAAKWEKSSAAYPTIPGISVYDFEPVVALRDSNHVAETADIFVNKWTQMRILNNMVKNWQPQDLQAIQICLMLIKMHIANARRILNVMQTVVSHQLNSYYYGEALMSALGFPMNEWEMRRYYPSLWEYFNVSIVGQINAIRWMTGVTPGEDRWAGLVTEIYKDTPIYTDYTQLFLFRPRVFWTMTSSWDSTNQAWLWQFTKADYLTEDLPAPASGYAALISYFGMIHDLIRDTFYDDSSTDIIAAINAIAERRYDGQVKSEFFNLPTLPFEGEEVKLTYDFDLLLAVHNATILPGADVQVPTQNVAQGRFDQKISIGDPSGAKTSVMYTYEFAKIVDLPWFNATEDDFINATQWTISGPPGNLLTVQDYQLARDSVGTEVLTRWKIYNYVYDQTASSYSLASRWMSNMVLINAPTMTQSQIAGLFEAEAQALAFDLSPIRYYGIVDQSTGACTIKGPLTQLEVIYGAGYQPLSGIHKQWVRNFWGFPIATPAAGQFKGTDKDAEAR